MRMSRGSESIRTAWQADEKDDHPDHDPTERGQMVVVAKPKEGGDEADEKRQALLDCDDGLGR
jgi:hypothetical protein